MTAILPINEMSLAAPHLAADVSEAGTDAESGVNAPAGVSFEGMLSGMVASANAAQNTAGQAAADFAAGRVDDIHGTMIALKRADIELHLVSTVRTKLVDAFNDLWKMSM